MSEQAQEESGPLLSPFLNPDAPPMIADPYAVPIADLNTIDGRLFQHGVHWEHFRRLRAEEPVHFNELPGFGIFSSRPILWQLLTCAGERLRR